MDRCRTITISGELGSGKSTVAQLLSQALNMKVYSTGDIQRKLAADLGMTSLELNKLAETDADIDRRIDNSTVEIAERENSVIFDSRLAWYFIPASFKVFMSVDPKIGAQRILNASRGRVEHYNSLEEAITLLKERRTSEDKRFKELYAADPAHSGNYDLVIDTSPVTPAQTVELILNAYRSWLDLNS